MARGADGALHVWRDGRAGASERAGAGRPELAARAVAAGGGRGIARITAPMPGAVLRLDVAEGDEVAPSAAVLLVLEAMKMEHPVTAPFDGRIGHVACRQGQQVSAGDLLVELAAESD